jgi:transcriptional regulator
MKAMPVDQVWSRTVREEWRYRDRSHDPIRTQQEVADILGITRKSVDQVEKRAIRKIAAELLAIGDEVGEMLEASLRKGKA